MTSPQIVPHSRKASRSCAATSVSEGGLDLRVVAITLCISAAVRETLAARRAMTRNYAAIKETGRGGRAGGIRNAPQLGHCGALKEGTHSLPGMRDTTPMQQTARVSGTLPGCLRLQLSSVPISAEYTQIFSARRACVVSRAPALIQSTGSAERGPRTNRRGHPR